MQREITISISVTISEADALREQLGRLETPSLDLVAARAVEKLLRALRRFQAVRMMSGKR